MLDAAFIRDNLDAVKANCAKRNVKPDVDVVVALDDRRKQVVQERQVIQQRQNEVAKATGKEKDPAKRQELVAEGKALKEKVAGLEQQEKQVDAELLAALKLIPNMTNPAAPVGGENDYKVVNQWGTPRQFDFKPLDHVAICEKLDLADFEAGASVAGAKFYFLKNEAVLLELGLVQYAMQQLIQAGFTPVITPDLARQEVLEGIGFQPRGAESNVYTVEETDLCLVATAEITLGGMHQNQILDAAKFPLRYAGLSHCFRREAGAPGRDTKGLYRVHQFTKVEMFVYCTAEESDKIHEELLAIEEKIFQGLELPYRVIDTASGDLGGPAYRKFDIEAWMPTRGEKGQGDYGEVTSTSNCTDYQARRLNIRYKAANQKGTRFAHTLNGTAVACTRALLAVLENNQQADGSVTIPTVLRPWVGKDVIAPRK